MTSVMQPDFRATDMFTRIVVSALFAGAAAGLITSLLQLIFVQPVLLHAELYESGELVHFGGQAVSAVQEVGGFDLMRDGLSIVFTMAIYTGYAFLLLAAVALAEERGHLMTARNGIIWGIAGFVAFHLAPGFSLAPEVPGVAAADVYARQLWWFPTVAAAAVALWLIAFSRSPIAWAIAAVVLLICAAFDRPTGTRYVYRPGPDRNRRLVRITCVRCRPGGLGADRIVCRIFLATGRRTRFGDRRSQYIDLSSRVALAARDFTFR